MGNSSGLRPVQRVLVHALLIVVGAFFLSPFLWMVSTSLKANSELFLWPPVWIPSVMEWRNYPKAIDYIPFFKYLSNTVTIAGLATVAVLFSCPLVAYSLARIPWKGAKPLFAI